MRRLFWIALGATAGVLVVRRLTAATDSLKENLTPASMIGSLVDAITDFTETVREAMSEREGELRDALGLDGRHDVVDAHTVSGPAGAAKQ